MPVHDHSLTVVLPVYQQAAYLPMILAALAQQDFNGSWDLVVCDDGSTQDLLGIVRGSNLAQQVDIQYVWQPDKGFRAGCARNRGIQCTSGQIIVFLDGDCLPGPGFLREHAEAHDGSSRVVCGSRSYLFLGVYPLREIEEQVYGSGVEALSRRAHMPSGPFQAVRMRSRSPWTALCGCNFSVRRAPEVVFDEGYVGWGMEDYELGLRLWSEHDFALVLEPSINVFHLEETPAAIFHPLRPKTAHQIAQYVANVLRISERHPSADLRYLWGTLGEFTVSTEGAWQLAKPGQPATQAETLYEAALAWKRQQTEIPSVAAVTMSYLSKDTQTRCTKKVVLL